MTAAPPPANDRPPLLRQPLFWILAGVGVLLVAAGVTVALGVGASPSGGRAPTGAAPATTTATPAAVEATEAPVQVPPVSVFAIPPDCAGMYTKDWSADMNGFVLNPAWAADPSNLQYGSRDDGLVTVLEATKLLTCKWASPNGGTDRGITTNVASLTPEQQASTIAHAQASGFDCYQELGGTRCVTETAPSADGQSGESHFLRDGVWIATVWINLQPDGYTHDMVAAIFGS
ncbi:hypothetical protein [Agromyces humi]|uniref:hypothetical protein n=1 Tax=Agromyces humi TaxID=1766800 RepID=UPI0013574664|nr:hypothetical protein [Agromyces humi]